MPINPSLKRFSIALPPQLVGDLDRLARRRRCHRAHLVREALETWTAAEALSHAVDDVAEHFSALERQLSRAEEATRYALESVKAARPAHARARARDT